MRCHGFLFAISWCILSCTTSRGHAAGNPDFITRLWQTEDGLPHNDVKAIAQTRDGYLWVGTEGGLARFDGVRFVVFDTNNVPAFPDSRVRALHLMRDGSLWIGFVSGTLAQLKDGKFARLETGADSLGFVLCIFEGKDGAVWIGTEGGLLRYAESVWSHFTTDDGLLHNTVRSLCEYQGKLHIATDRGGNIFADGQFKKLDPPGSGLAWYLRALWPDHSGNLWMGLRYGLGVINPQGNFTRYTRKDGLPDENETFLFEDRQTNLWIGSMGGLSRLRDGTFSVEQQADGTSYGRIRWLFEDREGNVWAGTKDGLNQLRPRRFYTYTATDGLAHNNVMSVLEDRNDTIWCAMWGGGLASLKSRTIRNYSKLDPQPNALITDNLLSICEEADGSILAGADYEGSVFRLQNGRFTQRQLIPNLTDQATRVIFRDHLGQRWLGLNTGLVLWNTREKWLDDTVVRAMVEDHGYKLWIGTTNGLYGRKPNGEFEHFTTESGLSLNAINCLHVGEPGELWIGTEGGGLNRFKGGRWTNYRTAQGLLSDQIGGMLEDDNGWFWLSSIKGIFRVHKSDFALLDSGKIRALGCINYGREDGLATVQCNDFAKPSSWKSRDGRLWFATIKGLAVINPRAAGQLNVKPPPVLIEELVADKRMVYRLVDGSMISKTVQVPPGRGDLEIRYTGLSLQVPERVRFKYKLDGRDTDWVDARDRRAVFYSNLQPGRYHFQVTACNNDGVWNQETAALSFVLLPLVWQTWWFKLAVLATLGVLGLGIYRFRANRFRQVEKLRMRIAADLHDDIGSNVASIALLSQLGQKSAGVNDADRRELSEINRIAEHTAHSIREIVWFINPDYDTLPEMVGRMKDVAATLLGGIEHQFDAPDDLDSIRLSLSFKRDMFLVFKEALHNIVKHSRAHRVNIQVRASKGVFHLRIQDDGVGFDLNNPGTGNGLKNLRLRLEHLGGKVDVESKPGQGTSVNISAKIARLQDGLDLSMP